MKSFVLQPHLVLCKQLNFFSWRYLGDFDLAIELILILLLEIGVVIHPGERLSLKRELFVHFLFVVTHLGKGPF